MGMEDSQQVVREHLQRWGKPAPEEAWMLLQETETAPGFVTRLLFHPLAGTYQVEETPDTFRLVVRPAWLPDLPARPDDPELLTLWGHLVPLARSGDLGPWLTSEEAMRWRPRLARGFTAQLTCASATDSLTSACPASQGVVITLQPDLEMDPVLAPHLLSLLASLWPTWLTPLDDGRWRIESSAPTPLPDALRELAHLGLGLRVEDLHPIRSRRVSSPPLSDTQIQALVDQDDGEGLRTALAQGQMDPYAAVPHRLVLFDLPVWEGPEAALSQPRWLTYAYAKDKVEAFRALLEVTDPSRDPVFLLWLLDEARQYGDVADDYWVPTLAASTLSYAEHPDQAGLSPWLWTQVWNTGPSPGRPRKQLIQDVAQAIERVAGSAALDRCWDLAIGHLPQMEARQAYLQRRATSPGSAVQVQLQQGAYDVALDLMRRYPGCAKGIVLEGRSLAEVLGQRKAEMEAHRQVAKEARAPQSLRQGVLEQLRGINQVLTLIQMAPRPRPRGP